MVNSAAGVINAALTQNRTAAGIALALESAQMLMTPETAAELKELREKGKREAVLDDFIARCEVALSGCCSECDAAIAIVKGRRQAALDNALVPELSAARLSALLAPSEDGAS